MQNRTSIGVWIGVGIAVIISISAFFHGSGGGPTPSAGVVNGGNVTNFTAVQTDNGYWVGSNQIANSSGILASSNAQFDGGILMSYTSSTSTTATTQTLVAADITNYSTVILTPNTNSVTLTLPASSTLSAFVPTAGDWAQQCWINATSSAAKNITFAAGTGIDLEVSSSSLVIAPGNSGCFRFLRKPATASAFDIIAQFTTFVDGD